MFSKKNVSCFVWPLPRRAHLLVPRSPSGHVCTAPWQDGHRRLNDPAIEITAKKIALAIARRRASRGARRRRYPGRDAALIWPAD